MTTTFELVAAPFGDVELHGLVHRPAGATGLVVHVHGTWGNFYGNSFVRWLATAYSELGFAFATVNFPGHDETAVTERIEDFPGALRTWLDVLRSGDEPLILQGHSLGAIKIATLLPKGLPHGTRALVLLAPFDSVAFNSRGTGGDVAALHARLNQVEAEGGEIAPSDVFEFWPISTRTLTAATTEGGSWDQFPTRLGRAGSALEAATLPVFVAVGGDDFAATPDPQTAVTTLGTAPMVTGTVIAGAPHNFAGRERLLVDAIGSWFGAVGLAR